MNIWQKGMFNHSPFKPGIFGVVRQEISDISPDHVKYGHLPIFWASKRDGGVLRMLACSLDMTLGSTYIDKKKTHMISVNSCCLIFGYLPRLDSDSQKPNLGARMEFLRGGPSRAVEYTGFAPLQKKHCKYNGFAPLNI